MNRMRRLGAALAGAALLSLPPLAGAGPASGAACALRVEVQGLRSAQGQVRIALFGSPERFLRQALRHAVADAALPGVAVCFDDLPAGDYAAAAYHDLNGNGRNDRNLLGIPSEPGAFSNGARPGLGPPTWDQARVSLQPPAVMRLQLP